MSQWILDAITAGGYAGIVLLMLVENVFPPIPSELIMPMAGYLASQDRLGFVGIVIAGTAGSVLGALPLYWLGAKLGQERLCRWAQRHGRWLALSPKDIDRAEDWFQRHGRATVFFCRLVPGLRSLISIPAGIHRMPMAGFLLWTTAGAAIWTALLAGFGWYLGSNFDKVGEWLDPITYAVVGAIVLMYAVRVVRGSGGKT